MTTIFILDVDGTVADCTARARLLEYECMQCLGMLSGIESSRDFECPHCRCMDSHMTDESWQMFIAEHLVIQDGLIRGSKKGVKALEALGHPVHYLTARPLESYEVTMQWLKQNLDFDDAIHTLQTRDEGDRTSSHVFKEAAFLKIKFTMDEQYNAPDYAFVDDNHQNLKMFARHGLAFDAPHFWDAMVTE